MTRVRIPPTLREQTGGERELVAEGDTVRDLLDDLMSRFPALEGVLAVGRTQSEVAAELGVRQTTVSYWARKAAA